MSRKTSSASFAKIWQIEETLKFIKSNGAVKVALQFPDNLLQYSSKIVAILRKETNNCCKFYILADTTYAPCCVDDIAAQHIKADCIIHYGPACFSKTNKNNTPVYYVIGYEILDWQVLKETLSHAISKNLNQYNKVLIIIQHCYYHFLYPKLIELINQSNKSKTQFIVATINNQSSSSSQNNEEREMKNINVESVNDLNTSQDDEKCKDDETASKAELSCKDKKNCTFIGYSYPLLYNQDEIDSNSDSIVSYLKDRYCVLYIGNDNVDTCISVQDSNFECGDSKDDFMSQQLYLTVLVNFGSIYNFVSINPNNPNNGKMEIEIRKHNRVLNQILMYRFKLIEKIKNANIIGIVIATFVNNNYLAIVNYLKKLMKKCGKKCYLLSVGKINECKLGNFSECETFAIITCPLSFHYLMPFQQTQFFSSLVTPFDCIMAYDNDTQWTAIYSTDFNNDVILNGKINSFKFGKKNENENNSLKNNNKDLPRYSAIDGKLHGPMENSRNENENDNESCRIVGKRVGAGAVAVRYDAASYMLEKRSWKGVEYVDDDVEPSKVEKGLTGIAMSYDDEIETNKTQ